MYKRTNITKSRDFFKKAVTNIRRTTLTKQKLLLEAKKMEVYKMTKKVVFSICTAMIVVFSFGFFKVNFLDRKESKLTVTNVDLQENCIYAIAKNQLYDADDEYIIHGASDYLKGQVQLSQIKEGETIIVISNGKVLQSDPYQFDTIYSIRPQ